MFRVFPTKVVVKLDSIVSSFTGVAKTFDSSTIHTALKDLLGNRVHLNLPATTLITLETAGPNGRKSAWGSSIDALAFIFYPKSLISYLVYQ